MKKKTLFFGLNYIFGAGPQGMIPRPEVRIYLASKKCFYLSEEINNTIQNTLADLGEEVTIEKVYEFIVGVFGSSKDLVSTDKIFIQGGKHPSLPSFRMLKKLADRICPILCTIDTKIGI